MDEWLMLLAYLYCNRTATLKEASDATGFSVEDAAAYYGGWHDYGYVTKYGNTPDSLVHWDTQHLDADTYEKIRKGREALDARAADKA
jgi:hypothetical protein